MQSKILAPEIWCNNKGGRHAPMKHLELFMIVAQKANDPMIG